MSGVRLILDRLLGAADVTSIVAARIHAEIAPQGEAMPYIVLRQSGRGGEYALDYTRGPIETRVVVQAFAKTYQEADALADAIESAVLSPPAPGATVFILDGVNVSDFVETTSAFRRAIEVRAIR